eukprot:TRINITY_DN1066_c0_g1_i5.p1 TRINITY_DN1066_c0_g1~~TRINITY_DN1066_c0_g1_i5.p1  ORF type:complete len:611 (-),score=102.77 TRINITY_DN1066_c0_g1_i5:113-1753(-)
MDVKALTKKGVHLLLVDMRSTDPRTISRFVSSIQHVLQPGATLVIVNEERDIPCTKITIKMEEEDPMRELKVVVLRRFSSCDVVHIRHQIGASTSRSSRSYIVARGYSKTIEHVSRLRTHRIICPLGESGSVVPPLGMLQYIGQHRIIVDRGWEQIFRYIQADPGLSAQMRLVDESEEFRMLDSLPPAHITNAADAQRLLKDYDAKLDVCMALGDNSLRVFLLSRGILVCLKPVAYADADVRECLRMNGYHSRCVPVWANVISRAAASVRSHDIFDAIIVGEEIHSFATSWRVFVDDVKWTSDGGFISGRWGRERRIRDLEAAHRRIMRMRPSFPLIPSRFGASTEPHPFLEALSPQKEDEPLTTCGLQRELKGAPQILASSFIFRDLQHASHIAQWHRKRQMTQMALFCPTMMSKIDVYVFTDDTCGILKPYHLSTSLTVRLQAERTVSKDMWQKIAHWCFVRPLDEPVLVVRQDRGTPASVVGTLTSGAICPMSGEWHRDLMRSDTWLLTKRNCGIDVHFKARELDGIIKKYLKTRGDDPLQRQ